MKLKSLLFIIISIVCLCPYVLQAQSSETTLKKYILSVEKKYPVTFSYDSDLLEDVPLSVKDTSGFDLKKLLEYMHEKTAFQLQFINDSVVVIRPEQEGANYKLQGKIIDQKTSEAMAGAYISNTKKTFGIISDENGSFEKYIRYSNDDTIVVSYMGYKSHLISLHKFSKGESVSISLKEDIMVSEEVTVTTYLSDGIKFNRLDNSIKLKPKDMALLPGQTDADLLMSLDALPGISSTDGKAGNLNIRGSSSDQTLITFDNIPIYHKGHYFGTLSPFNPKVVENMNVSRSSFTADKGGRVGGAIDIRTKQSIPDSCQSGVAISTVDGSAYTNIPIIKKRLGILLAGRTSYPNGWMSPKIKSISDFVFQNTELERAQNDSSYHLDEFKYNFYDWNAKVIARPTDKQTISISFLKIFNRLDAKIRNNGQQMFSYDSLGFNNWGLSGQWTNQWSQKINSSVNVTKSYFKQDQVRDVRAVQTNSMNGKSQFLNKVNDFDITTETNFAGERKNFLKLGYTIHYHDLSYDHIRYTPTSSTTLLSHENKGYIHSIFTSYNLIGHKKLKTSIGLRGNYYTLTKGTNLEPRLSVNYLLNDYWALKSSIGIQKQFITQVAGLSIESFGGLENMLWIMSDGKKIPVIKSSQVMAGFMFEKKGWLFDVEGYYKNIDDITVINIYDFSNTNSYYYGKSYTAGMDVLLRKSWKKFDAWASYTLSKSVMEIDSISTDPIPTLNDQRHILDLAGSYKWRQWKFSAGWKYRSGMESMIAIRTRLLHGPSVSSTTSPTPPPTPPGGGGPPTNPDFYEDDDGNPFYTGRYPAFHQLDVAIAYLFPAKQKQWNGSIGISLNNVYNKKNIVEQQHIRGGSDNRMHLVSRYSIGFAPNLVLSFNF